MKYITLPSIDTSEKRRLKNQNNNHKFNHRNFMSAKKTKQNKLNVNRDILYQMVLKTLSFSEALLQVRN